MEILILLNLMNMILKKFLSNNNSNKNCKNKNSNLLSQSFSTKTL